MIRDPGSTLPAILDTIKEVGENSGFKINWQKSELFPVSSVGCGDLSHLPFIQADSGIKYLGVQICRSEEEEYQQNLMTLTTWFENRVQRWNKFHLSIMGRVDLLKMIVLPKLLYIFQNVVCRPTKAFFSKLETISIKLIWGGGALG